MPFLFLRPAGQSVVKKCGHREETVGNRPAERAAGIIVDTGEQLIARLARSHTTDGTYMPRI